MCEKEEGQRIRGNKGVRIGAFTVYLLEKSIILSGQVNLRTYKVRELYLSYIERGQFYMKYDQKKFTEELKITIKKTESELKKQIEKFIVENNSVFAKRKMVIEAHFSKEGEDPFQPGYCSEIAIGISDRTDQNAELIDVYIIKIWECERIFLGLRISKHLPGSKVIGELIDESIEEIKEEMKEYIADILEEEI